MKQHKITKSFSILCCIAGLFISVCGLIFGIGSIGGAGMDRYNTVYIPYSIAAFLILTFDLLIAVNVIKNGFLFSCISSIIKAGMIIICLPSAIVEYVDNLESGNSIFDICVQILTSLIIMLIPSLVNAFSIYKLLAVKPHSFRCVDTRHSLPLSLTLNIFLNCFLRRFPDTAREISI